MSLQDALRGILKDGYSMQADTTAMQVFKAGDAATGVSVLVSLYEEMRSAPAPVDLGALWASLGVSLQNERVSYKADAPLSHIREQLLKP